MKGHTKFADVCAQMIGIAESKDVESHRWIVPVLIVMIEYSEAHELDDVAVSLIDAIEKVSPLLLGTKVGKASMLPDDGVRAKQHLKNVINFQNYKRNRTHQ